ncbi:MAG: hypothetical protein DMF25_03375 [Verrucomicrobia bacterium]|nr:MAG: hypothetical protein DMF25_03375 [Verrucomicrobiota bacterium]
MISSPVCILYTQDPDLVRRVKAFLRTIAQTRHVSDASRLDAVLQQSNPALLMIDLRAKESRDLLDQIQKDWPEVLIIALGIARSEPLREAEQSGIYAADDLQLDRPHFQALVGRAFDYLKVLQDNRELREESSGATLTQPPRSDVVTDRYGMPSLPLLRFPRVFRRFDNVDPALWKASLMPRV